MTPKKKAQELVNKFSTYCDVYIDSEDEFDRIEQHERAEQCALIAVNEIIKESSDCVTTLREGRLPLTDKEYWQKVLEAINQL